MNATQQPGQEDARSALDRAGDRLPASLTVPGDIPDYRCDLPDADAQSVAAGLPPRGCVERDQDRSAEADAEHRDREEPGGFDVAHGISAIPAMRQREVAVFAAKAEHQRKYADGAEQTANKPEYGAGHRDLRGRTR